MTTFQWIAIGFFFLLLAITLIAAARGSITRRVAATWSFVWLAAALTIARPEITAQVAAFLGIGRGADLVLYLAIIMMFVGFFLLYLRYRKVEEEITQLAREITLLRAEWKDGVKDRS